MTVNIDSRSFFASKNYGKQAYLDYANLKKIVRNEANALLNIFQLEETKFPAAYEEEVARVEKFFLSKIAHMNEMLSGILNGFEDLDDDTLPPSIQFSNEQRIRRQLYRLYTQTRELLKCHLLNRALCIKILKRYDALCQTNDLYVKYHEQLDTLQFGSGASVTIMQQKVIQLYANYFCNGDLEEAHAVLELEKERSGLHQQENLTLKFGCLLTLLFWFLQNTLISTSPTLDFFITDDPAIYLYAAVGSFIVYQWLWGVCVWLWEGVNIDFATLLSLDCLERAPLAINIFSEAATYSILFLVNIVVYESLRFTVISGDEPYMPVYLLPLSLAIATIGLLFHAMFASPSKGIFSLKTYFNLFTTPLYSAGVRETIAADILISFSRQLANIVLGACYIFSGTFVYTNRASKSEVGHRFDVCSAGYIDIMVTTIMALTYFIRFLQCCRYTGEMLANLPNIGAKHIDKGGIEPPPLTKTPSNHGKKVIPEMTVINPPQTDVSDVNIVLHQLEYLISQITSTRRILNNRIYKPFKRVVTSYVYEDAEFDFLHPLLSYIKKYMIWPHSYNALRYVVSLVVVVFGKFPLYTASSPYYQSWVISYIVLCSFSAIINSYWDFVMDWGLFERGSENFLRGTVLYKYSSGSAFGLWYYYFALIVNPILRSMWTLSFTPWGGQAFFGIFEIFRRCMWLSLKVEYYHIQNMDKKQVYLH